MSLFKFGSARRPQPSMERQLELANLLSRITYAMAEKHDLDGLFRVALRQVQEQLPAGLATGLLLKPKSPVFTIQTLVPSSLMENQEGVTEGADVSLAESGLKQVVQGASIHQIELASSGAPFTEKLAAAGLRSSVAIPITTEEGVQGVILVAREADSGFSEDESDMLHKLVQHLTQGFRQVTRRQESTQDQRLRALEDMAGGIAGEVGRALSPIVGFTETLRGQPSQSWAREQFQKYVEVVSSSVRAVDQVVRRLRAFHRDRDESEMASPIDLNELISDCLSTMGPNWTNKAKQKGMDIQFVTDLKETPLIVGNAGELRQVLGHIIDNAVDAMSQGGGTIKISTRVAEDQIAGVARVTMHEITVLEVTDAGCGMPDDVEQQCLEPFYSTKEGRLGLGLALVHGIVQRHEGRLEIESHEGVGTTVRIEFPSYLHAAERAMQTTAAPSQRHLTVLLVDDNAPDRESIAKLLMSDGHEVAATAEGREALEKLHAGWFDLAIIDRDVADMTGEQLSAAIKRIAPSKPIIMVIGFGHFKEETYEKPPGVNIVLKKPINLTDLRTGLAAVLPKRV